MLHLFNNCIPTSIPIYTYDECKVYNKILVHVFYFQFPSD